VPSFEANEIGYMCSFYLARHKISCCNSSLANRNLEEESARGAIRPAAAAEGGSGCGAEPRGDSPGSCRRGHLGRGCLDVLSHCRCGQGGFKVWPKA